jgi:NCS1 family nucleobase:cation symporter-1
MCRSAVIAFALALWGAGQFVDLLVKFLLLILYWEFPWMAIVLVDWAMSDKLSFKFNERWSIGATIWWITTILTIALFPASDLYTGPIAKILGGVDIGYYVGFLIAGVSYWAAIRYMPNLARVSPFSEVR